MRRGLLRTLGQKLHISRVGIPLWTVGLAMVLTAAAAGQAVGPVLTGSTSGSVNLVVEQAITLDRNDEDGGALDFDKTVGTSADDAVATVSDEGTAFTVALELNVGQAVAVCLLLENASGANASALLELEVPAGIDVEVEEFSDDTDADTTSTQTCSTSSSMGDLGTSETVDEAQATRSTWLLIVEGSSTDGGSAGDDDDDGVRILIEPKDDLRPGFYTITGRIVQVSG